MKDLTAQERSLCTMQGKIFEASTTLSQDGSAVFVRRFMRSAVAARMDAGTYRFEANSIEQVVEEVDAAYSESGYGSKIYSGPEMHWMGYIYRYICFAAEMSSKEAYRLIGARALHDLYYPYHSLDPAQTVERIMEAQRLADRDMVADGVKLLKKMRAQRS